MVKIAGGGHEAIVRLCHDVWGVDDVNKAMVKAAYGGHEAIVRLCLGWGADMSIRLWPQPRVEATNRSCGCV
jgi:hypothetical protein